MNTRPPDVASEARLIPLLAGRCSECDLIGEHRWWCSYRWHRRWLKAGTLAWALILLSSLPAGAQLTPDLLGDVDNWCITHSPCDYAAHATVTAASSVALAQVIGWEAEGARWVPVGLYAGKEVYDHTRWPDLSWGDTAVDMASVMVGAWIAPRVEDWLFGEE